MPKKQQFLVTVEFEVRASSEHRAKQAIIRGLDNGINDEPEIESAQITVVQ